MMRIVGLVFSFIAVLLGGLWLLQGLGIVQIRPILCFADCAPVQGPSTRWAVIGAVTGTIGGFGVFRLRKLASK
jgi:hypothetical protein